VLRAVATWLALAGVAAGVAAAAAPAIDPREPAPALPATARLGIAAGHGDERLAVWTARTVRSELCVGFRTGSSREAPSSFTCFRRGLEPPLVAVEHGGGLGGVSTWGVVAGLAAPVVARVSADTLYGSRTVRDLGLRPTGAPGWRAFTTGLVPHPTSQTVEAYDGAGRLITTQDGGSIHPSAVPARAGPGGLRVIKVAPPPSAGQAPAGDTWSDTAISPPPPGKGGSAAVSIALADAAVRSIVTSHTAWIDGVGTWWNCSGRVIGRVVTFGFTAPASFAATLPSVGRPAGNSSYAVTVDKVLATGWTSMAASVDAAAGAVVGVRGLGPFAPGASSAGTLKVETVVPAHDAGGFDSGDCWQSGD
jgi:hypothetical protein